MHEQHQATREHVLRTCLHLAENSERRFDKNVIRKGFPVDVDGRSAEDQLLEALTKASDGRWSMRRDPGNDDLFVARLPRPVLAQLATPPKPAGTKAPRSARPKSPAKRKRKPKPNTPARARGPSPKKRTRRPAREA